MIESVKTELNVKINNISVAGLVSVKTSEEVIERYAREILCRKPWAVSLSGREYTITLEYYNSIPQYMTDSFTVTIERGDSEESYLNCHVKSSDISYKNGKQTAVLVIKSNERE